MSDISCVVTEGRVKYRDGKKVNIIDKVLSREKYLIQVYSNLNFLGISVETSLVCFTKTISRRW